MLHYFHQLVPNRCLSAVWCWAGSLQWGFLSFCLMRLKTNTITFSHQHFACFCKFFNTLKNRQIDSFPIVRMPCCALAFLFFFPGVSWHRDAGLVKQCYRGYFFFLYCLLIQSLFQTHKPELVIVGTVERTVLMSFYFLYIYFRGGQTLTHVLDTTNFL